MHIASFLETVREPRYPDRPEYLTDKTFKAGRTAKRALSRTSWNDAIPSISLDAAGLIALADLSTIARRTALLGMAPLVDVLILCPGIHTQQKAPDLSKAELPPTAAMTTGYVFRVENQATVAYLQRIGVTGHLTTLAVSERKQTAISRIWMDLFGPSNSVVSFALVTVAALASVALIILLGITGDWWGLGILLSLVLARSLNLYVVRQRTAPGWHGAREPGVQGDLLILLSQDRWVRMQGPVDSLKAVTSGQWLQDMTFFQSSLQAIATLLVYAGAVFAGNATQIGKILLMALLLGSVGLLGLSNESITSLYMHGQDVKVVGKPKGYKRRLDLANELVAETKRHDWAVGLGMKRAEDFDGEKSTVKVTL